jgi:HAD superfamily hydrolase (TIGR01509 family)
MEIGFLFDNDGVLIDSQKLHWLSWQHLMQQEKSVVMDEKTFLSGFGKRNDLILKELVPEKTEAERTKLAETKEELFRKEARERIQLLDGMERFLKTLKEKKIPRIIASSTPIANLKMFLSSTVLGNYFDAFVSAEEVAHGKPFPDVFIEAAKRINLPTSSCIVIEDAPVGVKAGKDAGCFVVALCTTHDREELLESDMIFPSPHELDLDLIIKNFSESAWQ